MSVAMKHVLYLAWRYLAHHRIKTTILVLAIALIVFIPAALLVLVRLGEAQLTARAEATPLLLGAKDSPLELALSSLYFTDERPDPIAFGEVAAVRETGLAVAIPLHVRFHSRGVPIVGTSVDYFDFRGLRVARGRMMGRLGDCVVGADVARRRNIEPGGHVISSAESAFGFADGYSLKMRVTGVLAPSNNPDDGAIFVDVKTAWVIEGLAHGHEDLSDSAAADRVLRRDGNTIVASAAVREYQEITDENINSYHFHGDPNAFPITSVLVVPPDHKSLTILLGRYDSRETLQLVEPREIVGDLLQTVFAVRDLVVAAFVAVGGATLLLTALVFMLSWRLRRGEMATLTKIGAARRRVLAIAGAEIVTVLIGGLLLAAALTAVTAWNAPNLVRVMLMH